MMKPNVYLYILVMAVVTYAIRVLPLTLVRNQINHRFIRRFLYYVPYATLAVMTFPAILDATQSPIAGGMALLTGIVLAWHGASLFKVSISCCLIVFIIELVV